VSSCSTVNGMNLPGEVAEARDSDYFIFGPRSTFNPLLTTKDERVEKVDLTWSGDQPVERDVVLIRTSVDVVLVFWLAEGSDGTYERVGIWSPKPGEGTSTGDTWEKRVAIIV
jgi:hypothetical protein